MQQQQPYSPPTSYSQEQPYESGPDIEVHHNHPAGVAAHGFGQMFGLHPIPAVTTLVVNAMLFGGTILTLGALVPVAIGVALVLGYITYLSQKRFYQDDHDAALVKALAVALITAIPVGLPAFLTLPSAVVGFVHTLRKD